MGSVRSARPRVALFSEHEWMSIAHALSLSVRELQVVRLAFDGRKEYSIARELEISVHTVHEYMRRIRAKLEVADQRELLIRIFTVYRESEVIEEVDSCDA